MNNRESSNNSQEAATLEKKPNSVSTYRKIILDL